MNAPEAPKTVSERPDVADGDRGRLHELGYEQELARTLSLADVVIYGLIYMVPLAPVAVFGVVYNMSAGAVASVYVVAAIAMLFSAVSYKEMAVRFPVAGSVYSYVRMGSNRFLGFVSGWAILLDYLLLPALLCVFAASAMTGVVSWVPAWVWVVIFVAATALINIMGISVTAAMNKIFLYIQLAVLAVFLVWAAVLIFQGKAHLSLNPFIPADGGSWSLILGAVPVAALSYIGFDAISTLNEEAEGGGRTVSKATMIVLYQVTALFVVQVFVAGILVPTGTEFADGDAVNNAFYNVVGTAMADWFKTVLLLTAALIAIFANTIASNATSSRLVFSMARDGQLPKFLSRVSDKHQVPLNAMIFIAVLSVGVGILGVEQAGLLITLVTFGAITAYILLHVSVFTHFVVRGRSRSFFVHWVSPILGATLLLVALWNADPHAKIVGSCWLLIGLGVAAYFKLTGRSLSGSDA